MFGTSRTNRSKHGRGTLVLLCVAVSIVLGSVPAQAVDTTPPSVTISPTGVLTGIHRVSFNEPVLGVGSTNVVLRLEDPAANVATTLVCRNAAGAPVGCGGTETRVVDVRPGSPLIPGEHYVIVVNPEGAAPITDLSANPAPSTARRFLGSVAEEESSAAARPDWRAFAHPGALNGVYKSERHPGTRAIFRFSGSRVTWYTKLGPDQGMATVVIDGIVKGTVNNYRPSTYWAVPRWWDGLSTGNHTLQVIVRGQKGSTSATGAWVTADGFRAGTGPIIDAAYSWQSIRSGSAYAGGYARTATGGSRITFTFRGGGADFFTMTGPDQGRAWIYIDGRHVRTIDNYSPTTQYRVRRTITGLTDAVHSFTLIVAGNKNPASRGTLVAVDRWVLKASPVVFRRLGAWIDLYDYTSSTTDATIAGYVADLQARGVGTIYLQTGRYNTAAFLYPTQVGRWLAHAHAAGIKVVGWYFPAYSEYLSGDVTKTVAIASFVGSGNHRFDGLAIDIEYRAKTDSKSEFFNGISWHIAQVRARVGLVFPIGAITFAPLDMDRWVAGWSGFPWGSIAKHADAALPMGYWSVSSNRTRCAGGQTSYCPYQFTLQNIERTRTYTGLPVHDIGGVGHSITAAEVSQYVEASEAARAYGGSLYDYRTTKPEFWSPLSQLNSL